MREMREASSSAQKPGTTIPDPFSIAGAGAGAAKVERSSSCAFTIADRTTKVTNRSAKLFIAIEVLEKLSERDAKMD